MNKDAELIRGAAGELAFIHSPRSKELRALADRMEKAEPVAWINKDGNYVEISTKSTVYGSHTIPLYLHPATTEPTPTVSTDIQADGASLEPVAEVGMSGSDLVSNFNGMSLRKSLLPGTKLYTKPISAAIPEWISVEDGLPKAHTRVLIHYITHYGKAATTTGWYAPKNTVESGCFDGEVDDEYNEQKDTYYLKEGWVDESVESEYHYPISNVTHWMPLPPAPVQGE